MMVLSFLFALVTIIAVQVDGKMQMVGHGSQQVVCTCGVSTVTFTTACRAGTNCNQACAKKGKELSGVLSGVGSQCKFSAYEKKSKTRPGSGKTPITCWCNTPPSNEFIPTTVLTSNVLCNSSAGRLYSRLPPRGLPLGHLPRPPTPGLPCQGPLCWQLSVVPTTLQV